MNARKCRMVSKMLNQLEVKNGFKRYVIKHTCRGWKRNIGKQEEVNGKSIS